MDEYIKGIKKLVCKELEEMSEKRSLSVADVDVVYKLVTTKEKILRIQELEEKLGFSERSDDSYYSNDMNSNRSRSSEYADADMSGRRYSRSYSMADARHEVSERIRKMMDEEMLSENDRRVLREAYEQMKRN